MFVLYTADNDFLSFTGFQESIVLRPTVCVFTYLIFVGHHLLIPTTRLSSPINNTHYPIFRHSQETKSSLSHHVSRIPQSSPQHNQEPRALQTRRNLHDLSRRLQYAEHINRGSRVGGCSAMWSSRRIVMYRHLASNQQQLPCLPGDVFPQATPSLSRGRHHPERRQSTHGYGPGPYTTCGTNTNNKNGTSPGHHSSCAAQKNNEFGPGLHNSFRNHSFGGRHGHLFRDVSSGSPAFRSGD